MVEGATTAPTWGIPNPRPEHSFAINPACFGAFWCSLFVIMYISSLNVSSSKRSHPNTCLFVAQLSLLFVICLYCLSFIHNSSHMIQNRLIQVLLSCQTITVSIRQRVQFCSFVHNCHKLFFRQSGRLTVTCLNC